jgi:hypothetical protein
MTKTLTRRHILRGAGVALALPWLESLAPRRARGQAAAPRLRFVPIYFPLGTASWWTPTGVGAGDAWSLSPILAPLAPVKDRVTVLGHVDQTAYGAAGFVEPGNGLLTGAYLTSAKCQSDAQNNPINAISIDQRIGQLIGSQTTLPSLQLGLSTLNSYCDGEPCAFSRSISWQNPTTPLFKIVNPQSVFDKIVGTGEPPGGSTAARLASRKSVLDYVLGNAMTIEQRLGRSDRAQLDQFLTTVRDLEQQVAAVAPSTVQCVSVPRPTLAADVMNVPMNYNRDDHANVMIDLMVMALSCDTTRVISFMLDDARSDFIYDFLTMRHFTAAGSTPSTGTCGDLIGLENAGNSNDGWSTIDFWFVSKLAALCGKLAAVPDGGGASLLDNSVIWFGSGQQGEAGATNVPVLYVGGGGGALKVNQSLSFAPSQRLSNIYLTFLRAIFGAKDATFGDSTSVVPDIVV